MFFSISNLENLAGPERFELPTAGFEDQNSSTELRTEYGALDKN